MIADGNIDYMSGGDDLQLEDRAQSLIAYWRSKKSGDRLPARRDIDPVDIPDLLPHIGLIDVIGEGADFRYRLLGTHLNRVFGEDFTGKLVSETKIGAYGLLLMDLYRSVLTAGGPTVSDCIFEFKRKDYLKVRRVLLPLASDGATVDMILFMNIFRSREDMEIPTHRSGASGHFDQHDLVDSRELSRKKIHQSGT